MNKNTQNGEQTPQPHTAPARLALGKRVRDTIASVDAQLKYNIDNNTVSHINLGYRHQF